MKTKLLFVPFMALLLSLVISGCYVQRPYDPYYNTRYHREYRHRERRDRDWDRDRDGDRDRDRDRNNGYSRY